MGHEKTDRRRSAHTALGLCMLLALCLLALGAAPAQAAKEHVFDPTLSLRGDCSTNVLDEVPDPGLCPGTAGVDHPPLKFEQPCGTAADPHGDIYVANAAQGPDGEGKGGRINVFNPKGEYLAEIKDENMPCGVAVDSKGNVYVIEYKGKTAVLFKAKAYPPAKGAGYEARKVVHAVEPAKSNGGICTNAWAVAVDPSNDHVYVSVSCEGAFEYDSVASGGALLKKHEIDTRLAGRTGLAVYGRTHDIYSSGVKPGVKGGTAENDPANARVLVFDGASDALQCEIDGTETPQGGFGFKFGNAGVAVDQSNGDVYVDDINETSGHGAVDQFGSDCKYIGQITHSFKPLDIAVGGAALAYDAPCLDALSKPCGGQTYDSPNEGHLYVGQGGLKPNTYRVFAFGPGSAPPPSFALKVAKTGTGTGTVTSTPAGISCEPTCKAEYKEGTKVTLKAVADAGSEFAGWGGACSGTGACEVTMTEAKEVTAGFKLKAVSKFPLTLVKAGTGTGTVTSSPAGINCGPACTEESAEFPAEAVTLTASAASGSSFAGWKPGDCESEPELGKKCVVTTSSAKTVHATFNPIGRTLTISKAGSGTGTVKCEINGGPAEACAASYPNGTAVKLTATANAGSTFAGFSSGTGSASSCSTSPCAFALEADSAVTATFNPIGRTLTISKAGSGTGTVKCEINGGPAEACAASYPNGTAVKLTATANAGSTFAGFSSGTGSASSCSTSPCAFALEADSAVTATFNPIGRTLTISKAGSGTGTVKCEINGGPAEACAASYPNGTAVKLTATANAGSTFAGFSSGTGSASSCSTSPCAFALEADSAVTATFNLNTHGLTVEVEGPGEVTGPGGIACPPLCAATYLEGETVTLTATPDADAHFLEWSGPGAGACSGSATPTCEVQISAEKTVKATFAADTAGPLLTVNIAEGEGTVVSDPAGISCSGEAPTSCEAEFEEGSKVTLTASPVSGNLFKAWKGCEVVNGRQCTVKMSAAKTVGAKFFPAFGLTAGKSGQGTLSTSPGGINCSYACTESKALYKEGALTIAAKPNKHFHLVEFSGGSGAASVCTGVKTLTCAIPSFNAKSGIKATFAEDPQFTLSLTKDGGGQAQIKAKPTNINCGFTCTTEQANFYSGEPVTISWKLNKGTTSLTWTSGAGTCTGETKALEGTCTVTMSENIILQPKLN